MTAGGFGAVGPLGGATETLALSFNATPGAALQVNFAETSSAATLRGYKAVRIVSPAGAVGVSPGSAVEPLTNAGRKIAVVALKLLAAAS